MTERTSRKQAEAIRRTAFRVMGIGAGPVPDDLVTQTFRYTLPDLARDYLALLDDHERLSLAIRDIAFGNLSPEENERIASDAWYGLEGRNDTE